MREGSVLLSLLQAHESFYDCFPDCGARDIGSHTLRGAARVGLRAVPRNSGDNFAGLPLENLIVARRRYQSGLAEPCCVSERSLHALC